MLVPQGLTKVATHENQPLQHLVNLGQKKRTEALGNSVNGMNTGPQLTTQKSASHNILQKQIRPRAPNCLTKII